MKLLALDPGEVYCGWAVFEDGKLQSGGTTSPQGLFAGLASHDFDFVVWEEFRLYPWVMNDLQMTKMKVIEVIGVVRFICEQRGLPYVEQSAQIKKPTERQVLARGLLLGHGSNHCRDAQLHGYYYLLRGDPHGPSNQRQDSRPLAPRSPASQRRGRRASSVAP